MPYSAHDTKYEGIFTTALSENICADNRVKKYFLSHGFRDNNHKNQWCRPLAFRFELTRTHNFKMRHFPSVELLQSH